MEKFKTHITDLDFSNFRDAYNDAIAYYSRNYAEASNEMMRQDIFGIGRRNIQMGWKLLAPFVDYVSEVEALIFKLRNQYLNIRKCLEQFEEDFGRKEILTKSPDESVHYVNVFGGDALIYALYLAAADGILAGEESAFITGVLGQFYDHNFILEIIKSDSRVSTEEGRKEYEKTAMQSITLALINDRFYSSNKDKMGKLYTSPYLTGSITGFFKEFGIGLVGIDGEVSQEEKESIDTLLNNFNIMSESFAKQMK